MDENELASLTADIVTAYVANNSLPVSELPALIASVHSAIRGVDAPETSSVAEAKKLTPAQIKRSITSEGLLNFEDGKLYKSLKRNLATKGLTPDQYRAKWGLPQDYPMVSPAYSAARSALAKEMGLGQGGRKPPVVAKGEVKKPRVSAERSPKKASPKGSEPRAGGE